MQKADPMTYVTMAALLICIMKHKRIKKCEKIM